MLNIIAQSPAHLSHSSFSFFCIFKLCLMKHGQKEGTKEEIIYKNGGLEKNMIPIQ